MIVRVQNVNHILTAERCPHRPGGGRRDENLALMDAGPAPVCPSIFYILFSLQRPSKSGAACVRCTNRTLPATLTVHAIRRARALQQHDNERYRADGEMPITQEARLFPTTLQPARSFVHT